jgi:FkbM family methyltransferase
MSTLNLQWLAENFSNQQVVIFDIGCADMCDTVRIRQILPYAKIHAFECEERWNEMNCSTARQHNIIYHHLAMSSSSGQELFRPSLTFSGEPWGYSGNLSDVENTTNSDILVWGDPYFVKATTLNDFCIEHNLVPNFIHIDTEGAEYKIFANLNTNIRPNAIWSEITEYRDNKFDQLLYSYGYLKVFTNGTDALYTHNDSNLSVYYSLTLEQETELEWLKQYNVIRGSNWPDLETVNDFYLLPRYIQNECVSVFDLVPPKSFKDE